VLDQSADAHGMKRPGVASRYPDPLADGDPAANRRHVMPQYPELAVGRPGQAGQQIHDRRGLSRVVDLDAQSGLATRRLDNPETSRADGPAAAAPHADPGGEHWVRTHDHVAGWQVFPRI
jgi:hypothetical protein